MKHEIAILKALLLIFILTIAACGESNSPPEDETASQCMDNIDNDGDSLTDLLDPGCSNASDNDESDDPVVTQCNDGIDNDSDSLTDLDDPGCSNSADNDESDDPVTTQCADGSDNDSDSLIDLDDPGCTNASDDDESDDPLPAPQCSDGLDNDGDSLFDLADPGCTNASDDDESDDPIAAGANAERANSYDDDWETDWVNNAKTIISTPVTGITKTTGKVLQVGDSMTFAFPYGAWTRTGAGRTAEDQEVINWMHADTFNENNGWFYSTNGITAMNGAGWEWGFVDNIFTDPDLNDAQFAVIMFNVANMTFVESRIDQFIAAGIVPVLSTIPPRTNPDFNRDFADPYNLALRELAQRRGLPILGFSEEILLRRPGDTWIYTLIGQESPEDGVHPTAGVNGFNSESNPYGFGGDPATHTTGDALLNSGYLLRTWLTVQKIKEIKQKVID